MEKEFEYQYHIDRKVTMWVRDKYTVKADSKEDADRIIKAIADGSDDDDRDFFFERENLYDTQEDLGKVEVFDDNVREYDKMIYKVIDGVSSNDLVMRD